MDTREAPGGRVTDPKLIEQLESAALGEPVQDEQLIRQLEGLAPITPADRDMNDQQEFFARARRQIKGEEPPTVDPMDPKTGSTLAAPKRIISAATEAAKEAFTEGGELGIDDAGNVIVKAGSALADAVLRSVNAVVRGGAAAAGQTAREAGASQGMAARLERDLVGMTESTAGATPGAALKVTPKTATGASSAARAADDTQSALRAAERLGVEVPTGAVGNIKPRVAGALADTPVVGASLANAAKTATDTLEGTVARIADELGGATIASAGDTTKDSLVTWVQEVSKKRAAEIFAPVEALVKDTRAPLTRTGVALRDLTKQAKASGLPPPSIVDQFQDVLDAAQEAGGMTWSGMQRLRTEIGDRLSGNIVPEPGLSKRALKAVYAALSDDIEFLTRKAGGPAGVAEWKNANELFKSDVATRRSAIEKIVGKNGDASAETVAERILTMASDKRGADLERLLDVRSTLDNATWDQLASAALGRMGQGKDGFSLAAWRTAYAKLSDPGKKLLFSDDHRAALDDIDEVGRVFERLTRLGNPSGTGRMNAVIGGASLASINPLYLLGTVLTGAAMSKLLARPATAKAAADWSKAYANAAGKTITEDTFNAVKRAGLRLRSVLDAEGIEVLAVHPGMAAGPAIRSFNETPESEEQE
ncbi:MAG: hypothetical protein JNM89_15990 [Hyphomicrobiaceae bacterium]|nr:hypothetical protein [Hyphomicrobiaceae bacterium]